MPGSQSPRVLFAGGGTGGHLFPGLATASAIQQLTPQAQFLFVGTERPLEREILGRSSYAQATVPVQPLQDLWKSPIRFVGRSITAWRESMRIVEKFHPSVVVGLGGYVSVPVLMAARRQNVPTVLLEQNSIPGRATRCMAQNADFVFTSFHETASALPSTANVVLSGNPLRENVTRLHGRPWCRDRRMLLILGGSQGADRLNDAVAPALLNCREALDGWDIIHQAGSRQEKALKEFYKEKNMPVRVSAFLVNLPEVYEHAGLAIARAGATSLAELACAGIPSILLPYPESTDGHQQKNADIFVRHKAAMALEHQPDESLTTQELTRMIGSLVSDEDRREKMSQCARKLARPDAAMTVARRIIELLRIPQGVAS